MISLSRGTLSNIVGQMKQLADRFSIGIIAILLFFFGSGLLLFPNVFAVSDSTKLGVQGTKFTINGKPTFLFGISYYGALGARDEFIRLDLDDIQKNGFNWIRVWANWNSFGDSVSAVDEAGLPREPYMAKLRDLAAECDRRGMIVDITLSRGKNPKGLQLQGLDNHKRAVESIVAALAGHRNWYIDLSNERNVQDSRFTSFEELKELRDFAKKLAPGLLVTASHSPDISPTELQQYLNVVRVDFITPHRPRDANSPAQTARATVEYLRLFGKLNRPVPVLYQEPFRRGYSKGWNPTAEDFLHDALAARDSGAAGWCFHNGDSRGAPESKPRRSFDLHEKRLFDQLDPEELKAISLLRPVFRP
jgi:hypothetical protein